MQPARILELRSTYGGGGGPDKTILLSAKAHDKKKVHIHCLYLRGAGDRGFTLGERARTLGVSYQEIEEKGPWDARALGRLVQAIRAYHPHVVHTHDYKTDILGCVLSPLFPRTAFLATAHGWTRDNARMHSYNRADRIALRTFHHVIAVSNATRAKLLEAGLRRERVSLLYNGIDTDYWRPADRYDAQRRLRRRFGIDLSSPLVGFFGRLSPEKDVITAAETASRVLQAHPSATFLFIGDGSEAGALRTRLDALGMTRRAFVLGRRTIDPTLYQALDVYFMTSLTEGLPNTLLEAMACACPSVATPVGGIPELLGDSKGALLRPPASPADIADAIVSLLVRPRMATDMGFRARARIVDAFSFHQRLCKIEALYLHLVRRMRSPSGGMAPHLCSSQSPGQWRYPPFARLFPYKHRVQTTVRSFIQ